MKKMMSMKQVFDTFGRVLEIAKMEKAVLVRDKNGEVVRYDDGFGLILSDNEKFPLDGGARIPYRFVVDRHFRLEAADKPVLPVCFRQDEELRKALGILRKGESADADAKQFLEDENVTFLFANFTPLDDRNRRLKGILTLADPRYATDVVVRVEDKQSLELAAACGAKSSVSVRDSFARWNMYMIINLAEKEIETALDGHWNLICEEEKKMNQARRQYRKEMQRKQGRLEQVEV